MPREEQQPRWHRPIGGSSWRESCLCLFPSKTAYEEGLADDFELLFDRGGQEGIGGVVFEGFPFRKVRQPNIGLVTVRGIWFPQGY
jgi:hypothetical protein